MRCLDYVRHDMGGVDATYPQLDWMLMPRTRPLPGLGGMLSRDDWKEFVMSTAVETSRSSDATVIYSQTNIHLASTRSNHLQCPPYVIVGHLFLHTSH